jgi:hypothetical protein
MRILFPLIPSFLFCLCVSFLITSPLAHQFRCQITHLYKNRCYQALWEKRRIVTGATIVYTKKCKCQRLLTLVFENHRAHFSLELFSHKGSGRHYVKGDLFGMRFDWVKQEEKNEKI